MAAKTECDRCGTQADLITHGFPSAALPTGWARLTFDNGVSSESLDLCGPCDTAVLDFLGQDPGQRLGSKPGYGGLLAGHNPVED